MSKNPPGLMACEIPDAVLSSFFKPCYKTNLWPFLVHFLFHGRASPGVSSTHGKPFKGFGDFFNLLCRPAFDKDSCPALIYRFLSICSSIFEI
jgi:hypothetical protein